jgi:hypothetical protein
MPKGHYLALLFSAGQLKSADKVGAGLSANCVIAD